MSLKIISWIFGAIAFTVGVANIIWVHPVPGITYMLLSLVYFLPESAFLKEKFGLLFPRILKIALGIVIFFFTLGVSDLGDMIDKWAA
ncbi:MAG TPA: hypothetical protein VEC36_05305 [Patescibacteria group bacterium]|nr:hypothetical protein [Patescibacteria group bacterium]